MRRPEPEHRQKQGFRSKRDIAGQAVLGPEPSRIEDREDANRV